MGLKWDDSLLIGIPSIDGLHKELFDSINEILEVIKISEEKEAIEKKISFFQNYIVIHFKEEELIQEKYNHSSYNKQHGQHEELKRFFELLKKKIEVGEANVDFIKDIESKIGRWWREHINNLDNDLEKFLKEKNKIIRY